MTDTERLDWLDKQSDGTKWVARNSGTGRGFRLHNIGVGSLVYQSGCGWDVRSAIDSAATYQAATAAQEARQLKSSKPTVRTGETPHEHQ